MLCGCGTSNRTASEPWANERTDERLPRECNERDRSEECFCCRFLPSATFGRAQSKRCVLLEGSADLTFLGGFSAVEALFDLLVALAGLVGDARGHLAERPVEVLGTDPDVTGTVADVLGVDFGDELPARGQCGLPTDGFYVRADVALGPAGQRVEINVVGQWLASGMDREDRPARGLVRDRNVNVAIQPARTEQRRVDEVRSVGGRDDDDVLEILEPVEFGE